MKQSIATNSAIVLFMLCAQSTLAADVPALSTATQGDQLETITVTAQKRLENISDIPIAITAVTSDQLNAHGVNGIENLQLTIPGLQFNAVAGDPNIFLRGVGTDVLYANADPSVVPYVDGVFVGFSKGYDFNIPGLDRIEVLEGPQGTLYGRNAVGGAINFITRTPTQDFHAQATMTAGDYDLREFSGYVEGGITDNLTGGLYALTSRRNSYTDFLITTPAGADLTPRPSRDALRGKLVFDIGALKLTGSFEYQRLLTPENGALRQTDPNALGFVFGAVKNPIRPYQITTDSGDSSTTELKAGTLREEYDLGFASILGISAFRYSKDRSFVDFDATSAPLFIFSDNPESTKQYSQELQLISKPTTKFKWIAGVFFYHENGGFDPEGVTLPTPAISPIASTFLYSNVSTYSYAAFGEATYSFTDQLRLTVGGRGTKDEKYYSAQDQFKNLDGSTAAPTVVYPSESHDWNVFTPKVTVDYRLDSTLLYGTFSQGYKPGVYNITAPTAPGPVDPERLSAFEIGSKSTLLNNRLDINAALYHYKFKDQQVSVVNGAGQGITSLQNAASSTIYGADFSVNAIVAHGLELNLALAYNHAKYDKFLGFPGVGDVSGNTEERAPRWTSTTGFKYNVSLANAGSLEWLGNWYYNSGYFWDPSNLTRQGSYNLFNATTAYITPDGHTRISMWGKNLANKYYETYYVASAFGVDVIDAPPRTFGATVSYSF